MTGTRRSRVGGALPVPALAAGGASVAVLEQRGRGECGLRERILRRRREHRQGRPLAALLWQRQCEGRELSTAEKATAATAGIATVEGPAKAAAAALTGELTP